MAELAGDADLAAVRLDDLLARCSKARGRRRLRFATGRASRNLIEALEQVGHELGGDAGAGVGDLEAHLAVVDAGPRAARTEAAGRRVAG